MRTSHSFATVCVFAAAFAAVLPACGSTDDPPASGGCSTTAEGGGDAAKGSTLYASQCTSCHGPDASGNQGPNITMSTTAGIGTWTYGQFYNAVRSAKDKDGAPLCIFMTAFGTKDVSDCGAQDIYAFLKTKAVNNTPNKGSYCP